jgi:hypothetical protein
MSELARWDSFYVIIGSAYHVFVNRQDTDTERR